VRKKNPLSFHQKLRYTEKTGWWIGISPIFIHSSPLKSGRIPCDTKINQRRFWTRPPHPPPILPPQVFPVKLHVLHLHPQRHPVLPLPVRGRDLAHLGEGHLQELGTGEQQGGSYGIFGVWWEKWGNNWGFHGENMFFWWERLTKNEMVPMDLIDFRWFFNLNWRFHPFFCQETWNVIYVTI